MIEKRERDANPPGSLAIHHTEEPGVFATARKRGDFADLRNREHDGFVPDAGYFPDQFDGRIRQNVFWMGPVSHQRGREDYRAGNLMSPGGFLSSLTEMHRRVISVARQKPREGQRRVMTGAFFHAAIFQTANGFAA